MKVYPLADIILVSPNEPEEKTVGGIIIPDTAKERPLTGVVKEVGPGTKDEEMRIKVGDTVLFDKRTGTEFILDDEKWLFMHQYEVFAVINEDED